MALDQDDMTKTEHSLYSEFDLSRLDEGKNAAGNIRLCYCVAEVRLVSFCLKLLRRKIFVVSVNCE